MLSPSLQAFMSQCRRAGNHPTLLATQAGVHLLHIRMWEDHYYIVADKPIGMGLYSSDGHNYKFHGNSLERSVAEYTKIVAVVLENRNAKPVG